MNLKENECNQYRADADASKLNFWLVSLISKLPKYTIKRKFQIILGDLVASRHAYLKGTLIQEIRVHWSSPI